MPTLQTTSSPTAIIRHHIPAWIAAPGVAVLLFLGLILWLALPYSVVNASESDDIATLVIQQSDGGVVLTTPNERIFPIGTAVTLTAIADPGRIFSYWSGTVDDAQKSQNPLTLIMNRDRLITPVYFTTTYTVTTNVTGSGTGTITRTPEQSGYVYGTVVTMTANAGPTSNFSGWEGDLSGNNPVQSLTIIRDSAVTATFSISEVRLRLLTDGDGGGTVSADPPGPIYPYGQAITLTATPDWLSSFVSWRGGIVSSSIVEQFVMTQDTVITATFARNNYLLDVVGDANGSVIRQPDSASYPINASVTVTAIAEQGWNFLAWDGDLTGYPATTSLTLTADITATAYFTPAQYLVNDGVSGGGTIVKTPNKTAYGYGEQVILEATPEPGWRFNQWLGDVSGQQTQQTLTITNSRNITAEFTRVYQLEVSQTGEGDTIYTPKQNEYLPGTNITITAEAAPGWQFTGWSGDIEDGSCCLSLKLDDDRSIHATFKQLLTLFVIKEGNGSSVVTPEQSLYLSGDTVRLRAFPDPGWRFAGWRGDIVDGKATVDYQVIKNSEIIARFARVVYEYDLRTNGRGAVATDPPGPFILDEAVALVAVPAREWSFLGWSQDIVYDPAAILSTDRVFITRVSDDETYVAHFKERDTWLTFLPLIR